MKMNNEWVKDPKIFNVNRLSATASIHRYASIKELKEKQLETSSIVTIVQKILRILLAVIILKGFVHLI